jgi:multidrug efflux system membrane fusion protein
MKTGSYGKTFLSTPLCVRGCWSFLFVMGLCGIAVFFVSACSRGEKGTRTPKLAVPVTVATAVEKNVPVTVKAIGSVEAFNTVSVRARIGGALTRVAFTEGQDVAQGNLLLVIDSRP